MKELCKEQERTRYRLCKDGAGFYFVPVPFQQTGKMHAFQEAAAVSVSVIDI